MEIKNLTKVFGREMALNNLSLSIVPGEMVGIIGRSGAGKSTLLRSINHLVTPTSGEITWEGQVVNRLKVKALRTWQRNCGMIFQQFNLIPRLDVLTNVLMGRLSYRNTACTLLKLFSEKDRALAISMLARVEMEKLFLQRADTLSGGEQQRVAIARALVQQPSMLLADEPIASLDPRSAKRVMDILQSINRDDGITVLCNLHTIDTAKEYCTRIVGMLKGQIVFDGTPAALDAATVRRIYGVEDPDFSESTTSVSLTPGVNSKSKTNHPHTKGEISCPV